MPSTDRSRGAAATAAKARNRQIADEADEFVEIEGTGGGDFPDTWDFDSDPVLIGTFVGTETKLIKGKDRTIHTFEVDGETFNAWGTAILDDRLSNLEGNTRVKVEKTGAKLATQSGNGAWEFKVFAARGAISR